MSSGSVITSLQNERIKAIRALQMRKVRKETGLFVAEGASLLVTARDEGWKPETLIYRGGPDSSASHKDILAWARAAGADTLEVSEAVLAKVASKDNPQTMLGVFRQKWAKALSHETVAREATWIVLDEVRDPGNLGTIIRTVDATGAAGVILSGTCCDPYSLEAIRATMGSIFAVPLIAMPHSETLALLDTWRGDIIATHLDAKLDYRQGGWRGPTLILMGSEGPGLSDDFVNKASHRVRIPMAGKLDSLNLAVATALMLYEVRRPFLKLER